MKRILTLIVIGIATISFVFSQSFTKSPLNPGESVEHSSDANRDAIIITHSASQSIIGGNSVSCNSFAGHTDNSYIRVFDFAGEFGVNEDLNVTAVEFGVEVATGAGGAQPVTVNIYTLLGPLTFANMTLIASQGISLPDQSLSIVNVPISAFIPAGSLMVVEVFTPNGQAVGNSMWVGSNNLGQTAQTFLAASDCGVPEPTDIGVIGFPDMHFVLNVYAESAQQVPVSNWAIIIGLILITGFVIFRMRR